MKVICINYGHRIPKDKPYPEYVKEGSVYTVRCEETGFSEYANKVVEAYGFEEMDGLFEKGMFMPLSDFDERLIKLLRTKPVKKKVQK